jgi:lauroyl/myristoyl acyltransferase
MKRLLKLADARTLARIINLAERCRCTYTFVTAEYNGDLSYYHVHIELRGSDDSLRLLDSQIEKIIAYDTRYSP